MGPAHAAQLWWAELWEYAWETQLVDLRSKFYFSNLQLTYEYPAPTHPLRFFDSYVRLGKYHIYHLYANFSFQGN